MTFSPFSSKIHRITYIKTYGSLKYLTYHCLLFQFANCLLHVAAFIAPRVFEKPRDIVFTCFAYPLSIIVVSTFWSVWHLVGREYIFPVAISEYYPTWLNHVTHTVIGPLNLLMAILVKHSYSKRGQIYSMLYYIFYISLLHYIKMDTGKFVYQYLDKMSNIVRPFYFMLTAIIVILFYESGKLLTEKFHKQTSDVTSKKSKKQKQVQNQKKLK